MRRLEKAEEWKVGRREEGMRKRDRNSRNKAVRAQSNVIRTRKRVRRCPDVGQYVCSFALVDTFCRQRIATDNRASGGLSDTAACGERWKASSATQKAPFEKRAKDKKTKYVKALKKWYAIAPKVFLRYPDCLDCAPRNPRKSRG